MTRGHRPLVSRSGLAGRPHGSRLTGGLRRGTRGRRAAVMNHGVLGRGLGPHRMRVGLNIIGVLGYLVVGINDIGDIITVMILIKAEGGMRLVTKVGMSSKGKP